MIRLAALGILLVTFIASIDAFPKNRLDARGRFNRKIDNCLPISKILASSFSHQQLRLSSCLE